jgi:hypothetical protein
VPQYRQDLANAYNCLASFLAQKQDPCLFVRAFDTTVYPMGSLLVHRRNQVAAGKAWEQARDLFARLATERPNVPAYQGDLGMVCANLGWLRTQQNDWMAARPELDRAVACLKDALKPPNDRHPDYRDALRSAYQTLAETLLQLKLPAAAAEAAVTLATVFPDRGVDCYYAACFLARCVPLTGDAALQQRCTDQAIDLLRCAAARGVPAVARLPEIEEHLLKPLRPDVVRQLLAELPRRPAKPNGPRR